jgi:hypothetical protein
VEVEEEEGQKEEVDVGVEEERDDTEDCLGYLTYLVAKARGRARLTSPPNIGRRG